MGKRFERDAKKAQDQQADQRIHAGNLKLIQKSAPPDTLSVRAKSSGHGKVTADKWNQ